MKPATVAKLDLLLTFAEEIKTSTTYVPVAKTLGVFSGGNDLAEALGEIQRIDDKAKRPFRSSLVVSVGTGVPGKGYFHMARSLGHTIGATPADEFLFWKSQMDAMGVLLSPVAVKTGKALGVL